MSTEIDITPEQPNLPAIHKPSMEVGPALPAEQITAPTVTPQQARVEAVAGLLHAAYAKASTLTLTPDEVTRLGAEFPDDAFRTGAAGKENLIYIEHAALRQRLNEVLGIGQWSIVVRNKWVEEFDYLDKASRKNEKASRVYVEGCLLIRGCFVAEAIGDQVYYPKNQQMNYGDAVEGAKSATLRRCAKELGVGLQAWRKDFCEKWMKQYAGRRPAVHEEQPQPTPTPRPAPAPAKPANVTPMSAANPSELLAKLKTFVGPMQEEVESFLKQAKSKSGAYWLAEWETLDDLPEEYLTILVNKWSQIYPKIEEWLGNRGGDDQEQRNPEPEAPIDPPAQRQSKPSEAQGNEPWNAPDAPWRSFVIPFGKQSGKTLADVPKNFLYGFWAGYKVETEYNGKPKKPETVAKDQAFRDALDEAGKHYAFEKKEEETTP